MHEVCGRLAARTGKGGSGGGKQVGRYEVWFGGLEGEGR